MMPKGGAAGIDTSGKKSWGVKGAAAGEIVMSLEVTLFLRAQPHI